MAKKSINKLLSVILTMAICATAIFGCLITANAQDGPSYVITGAQCKEGTTAASATVSFTVPRGMAAGIFTIDNTGNWYSSVDVSLHSALAAADDNVNIDIEDGVVIFDITDGQGNAKAYSTITLKLDFVFNAGIENDINITISDLDFNGIYYDENYTEFAGTNGVFTAGCTHNYSVSGTPAYTDSANGYAVYTDAVCSLCGEAKGSYQVVPVVDSGSYKAVSYTAKVTTVELLDPTKENSETNPYIINDPGQIFALGRDELTYNGSVVGTNHEYFKVADGIDAFYINGGETVAKLTSAAEVKTYFEKNSGSTWWSNANSTFNGNFDGNGVTIYGLYSDGTSAGLFPYSSHNSTTDAPQKIKNITIKNSYLTGTSASGAIIGNMRGNAGSTIIENCTSVNNYVSSTHSTMMTGGALLGRCYGAVTVNNCLAYDNIVENSFATDYNKNLLIGYSSGATYVTNVIAIGVTPWDLAAPWARNHIDTGNFVNVFTDQDVQALLDFAPTQNTETNRVKYNINGNIATSDFLGANAAVATAEATAANKAIRDANGWPFPGSDLAWGTTWFVGKTGQYPSLLKGFSLEAADASNTALDLLAVNIEYLNSGNFNLNFHYAPTVADAVLYVANAQSATGFQKIETSTVSPFAGSTLPEGARMFTLTNISAKDIDVLWLPTIIAKSDEVMYGKTEQISVEDYATAVIDGNAFYPSSTTDEQKTADKNVAAALINYGYAAKDAIASTTLPSEGIVDTWTSSASNYNWWYDNTFEGSGTEDKPYIIDSAEGFAYVVTQAGDETAGKYYKVADGIAAFNMNTTGLDLSGDLTPEQIKSLIETEETIVGKTWFNAEFQGHFDGNGVTVYGLHCGDVKYNETGTSNNYAGLFTRVKGNVTIKNITVKNSYFKSSSSVGGIIGSTANESTTITIENCAVINNYMNSTNAANGVGGLVGLSYGCAVESTNCLVALNEIVNESAASTGLIAYGWGVPSFTNIVSIGITPFRSNCDTNNNSWHHYKADVFSNVYTDQDLNLSKLVYDSTYSGSYAENQIKRLTLEQMKGKNAMNNMPALDWNNVWVYGDEGQYPMIIKTSANEGVNTYDSWEPAYPTINGETKDDWYDENLTLLDPSQPNSESNPYIIHTAEQLAAVVNAMTGHSGGNVALDTTGKYYKVADGIKAFYMVNESLVDDLDGLNSAEEVKAFFDKNGTANTRRWWEGNAFKGYFDGNGVTVYGIYGSSSQSALFNKVSGNVTIKNVTLAKCYFSGAAVNGGVTSSAAGIIAETANDNATITLDKCGVIDNYMSSSHVEIGVGGLVARAYGCTINANNCLIKGNVIKNTATASTGLVAYGWTAPSFNNIVAIGVTPFRSNCDTYSNSWHYYKADVFSNVYTDQDLNLSKWVYDATYNGSYAENQIKQLTLEQMQGAAAQTNMSLAWGTDWFVGNKGEYPSLTPVEVSYMPSGLQSQYDSLTLDNYDNYGDSTDNYGVYATSLNLKANPYIAFTFVFGYEYTKEDIQVTFKSGNTVIKTVTAADMTNNEGAGRYHLYRLKDIPVKYLADGITVTVSYNGTTTNFGTFSVEGFALEAKRANRILPGEYYSTKYEAAKALLFYAQMVNARYGA